MGARVDALRPHQRDRVRQRQLQGVSSRGWRSRRSSSRNEPNAKPTISREEAAEWARKQDEYIADQDMVLIEGYIGPEADFRTATQLFIEKANGNVPAMQQQLYFPADEAFSAEFTVIYTPNLPAPGKPNDCLITVDRDNYVTRVFGSDYFGESKMGGLRMWNKLVYDRGGLAQAWLDDQRSRSWRPDRDRSERGSHLVGECFRSQDLRPGPG